MEDAVLHSISSSGRFVVNKLFDGRAGYLKLYSLQAAARSGLHIPDTIITSSGRQAKNFIAQNESSGRRTILKGLELPIWNFADGRQAVLSTTLVTSADVDDESLSMAPCIFQEEVPKEYEVRVVVLGATLWASRLASQTVEGAGLDYRCADSMLNLGALSIEVPGPVREAMARYQASTGLITGSMDFIVTPDGRWTFLEDNPSGQFLWLEDINPEAPLLDAFAEFIASGDERFKYDFDASNRVRLTDFEAHLRSDDGRSFWQERKEGAYHRDRGVPEDAV